MNGINRVVNLTVLFIPMISVIILTFNQIFAIFGYGKRKD